MSDEEQEYEVEFITQARVEKARGKKKKLIWKYNVRWKGYGPEDDTWEPAESFEGSEHILERFWQRANAGGRDYRDMSVFKAGEEFVPTGPPRRKAKRKSVGSDTPTSPPTLGQRSTKNLNEKRRRSPSVVEIEDTDENRPAKRARETSKPAEPSHRRKERISLPERGQMDGRNGPQQTPLPRSTRPTPKKSARAASLDEIVPPSDDELEQSSNVQAPPSTSKAPIVDQDNLEAYGGRDNDDSNPDVDMYQNDSSKPDTPDPFSNVTKQSRSSSLPFHRAKAANPRVKMVDNPHVGGLEGAIPVKARLVGRSAAPSPSTAGPSSGPTKHAPGARPGPGRSSSDFLNKNTNSLLTFAKGELKTVKGRNRKELQKTSDEMSRNHGAADLVSNGTLFENEVVLGDEIPGLLTSSRAPARPTADELLRLAGGDQEKETLPDFEDEGPATALPVAESTSTAEQSTTTVQIAPVKESQPDQTRSSLQQSLALAKDKLFPSGATAVMNTLGAAWKRSTIFGPLGLGSDPQAKPSVQVVNSESTRPAPFFINLDTSASIPVILADASPSPSGSPSLGCIVSNKGPPGKFYSQKSALALLDTVRTGGPSAKVVPDTYSTPDQRSQFELFHSRLSSGELFVAMAGVEVLAFCSSDNTLIAQRLNISPLLLGQPGTVLVARVVIENYSAYADAALDADGRRWHWAPVGR
ncbi:hypothetical protein LshimejAT787_0204390 [Lyophyllum shimeji]|uniref:Chromo domain-containing protein n=1 Tax=Lyophyllum shimeji TaxID=47721 RepID=A0A9P3PG80_LYOSH|nr:hypothetical protein LshimejAT787_0204390 [Lyophyllum shimeji]